MSAAAAALIDAAALFRDPRAYFTSLAADRPLTPATRRIVFWALLAALFDALLLQLGLRSGDLSFKALALMILIAPLLFLLLAGVSALLFYGAVRLIGGKPGLKTALRAAAAVMPLFFLDILFGPLLVCRLALIGAKMYFAAIAAETMFAAPRLRARILFALVGLASAAQQLYRAFA